MATIRKRNGKWQVIIRKKFAPPITKTFIYQKDAETFAREKESQIDRGLVVSFDEAARTTLGQLMERYRNEITSKKRSADSEDCKIKYICRQPISDLTLMRITPSRIAKFRDALLADRKPATAVKYLAYISNAWNVAQKEWGVHLPQNPVAQIKKPVVYDRRDRVLTKEEYKRILEAAEDSVFYMKGLIIFAYETAARYGEIMRLHKDDVSFENRTATFRGTKNGEDRQIPLSLGSIEALKSQPPSTSGHFFNVKSHDSFKYKWLKVKAMAEVENFRFHDLRACAITNFMLPPYNFTIAQTAVISGHKSWDELKRYERIKASQLVVEFKRLNK